MNCKPGESAFVVRSTLPGGGPNVVPPELVGLIVTVGRLLPPMLGQPIWRLRESISFVAQHKAWASKSNGAMVCVVPGRSYQVNALPDACLLPIRPSDEPDETLAWPPVPSALAPA